MTQFKLFSLILSSFFIFSCQHTHQGKFHLFKKSHHSKKSCCGKSAHRHGKKSCCGKYKESCKSKKWGKKDSCKSKKGKHSSCKSKRGKRGGSCQKGDSVIGLALVKGFGNKIKGSVSFERVEYHQVKLNAEVEGLQPNKKFGFHVHEFGNCENKAVMAGAHLNPGNYKHGNPQDKEKHLGDLGNLSSDKEGKAQLSMVLNGKLKMFMGRSVIIHESEDDLKSQPTGNAGKRIACGIIGAGMPPVKLESESTAQTQKKQEKASTTKIEIKKAMEKTKAVQPEVKKAMEKTKAVKPEVKKAAEKTKAVQPEVKKAVEKTKAVQPEVKKAAEKTKAEQAKETTKK